MLDDASPPERSRRLQVSFMEEGSLLALRGEGGGEGGGEGQADPGGAEAVRAAREHHRLALSELPRHALDLAAGDPCLDVKVGSER